MVDDNADNRDLLLKLLSPFGFDLREGKNGQHALEIWEAWKPHLILMDIRMPVMDGYEATKKIRNLELNMKNSTIPNSQFLIPHCKIIALTASAFEADRSAVLSAGCDEFIRKPFQDTEIVDALHRHLGLRFLYEEEQQSPIANRQSSIQGMLTPEALAVLPAELLQQLEHAAIEGDADTVIRLIERIRPDHATVADALAALAKEYDYQPIVDALHSV